MTDYWNALPDWTIAFWLCCGAATAFITRSRGYSVLRGMLLGIVWGPIGFAAALAARPNPKTKARCPWCRSWIDRTASVCPHCAREQYREQPVVAKRAGIGRCPTSGCGTYIYPNDRSCPKCGILV